MDQPKLKGDPGVAGLVPIRAQNLKRLFRSPALPVGVGSDERQHRVRRFLRCGGQPAIRQLDGLAETLPIHQLLGPPEQGLGTQLLDAGLNKATRGRELGGRVRVRVGTRWGWLSSDVSVAFRSWISGTTRSPMTSCIGGQTIPVALGFRIVQKLDLQ